ncbi:MAG: PQQ-dependent sugar dehydrogenase [Actinomycetota bacterium]|nr:PQQ-dependent sugar dehydrogenase [Actinomycetota bacterium]
MRARTTTSVLAVMAALGWVLPALGQRVPDSRDEVARPGGDLPGDPKIALVKIAAGFSDPTNVTNAGDGSGRIFVVERIGRIEVVDRGGDVQEEPFLDLTALNPWGLGSDVQTAFIEQGLYAVAFDPQFKENGHFYVHYASLPFNGDGLIVRFTVDPESPDAVTPERADETAKVIMRIEQPWFNHNGGQIAFGPDGYLYNGTGDGGYVDSSYVDAPPGHEHGDPLRTAQVLSTRLGKLLRIDVDTEDAPYRVPGDNPFARATNERPRGPSDGTPEEEFAGIKARALPEIWAYGLRNPYTFHFDPRTGDLFIADVGHESWEEINWQPAGSKGGQNYGWSRMEASHCHPTTGGLARQDCTVVGVLPVAEYAHGAPDEDEDGDGEAAAELPLARGWGCSVQGFGVANYGGMAGVYLAGDWCSGRVWGLGWDPGAGEWQLEELLWTDLQFTAGGYDEDGRVLAVNCVCSYYRTGEGGPTAASAEGALWRIVPADEVPEGAGDVRTAQ